jgi:hypothetical protein
MSEHCLGIIAMKTTDRDRVQRQKNCVRCGEKTDYSGEWYGDLCPECADETDGEWVCRYCARSGNFEEMGGSGAISPICCGSVCDHISRDI